ncbi:zinc finger, CCHC-type containing protein [Tanacetum coccineum]
MTIEDLNSALITQKPVAPITHYQYPTLKLTNYTVWAIQTKVILEAHGLWEMIEPKENTQVNEKKDKAMIAFLYQALTKDVILQVAGCETAKELWESLKKRHVGEEKVQHYKRNCKGTSTPQEQSNLILEDDEPSLFMTIHKTEHEEVLLNKGQIQPGKYATTYASIWYLDNGACNHMTGTKSHFKDIDKSIIGRVRFGDGSYVEIKGRGSILLGYNQAWLWHARLGHLNFDDINKMTRKGLVEGIPRINHAGQICDACLLGKHSRTPFPNQDQNGVVERKNRTVLSTTRSMKKAMKLPLTFWAEAVKHALYILNRVPTRALVDKTPYEASYNRKPNLEHLRIFGCTTYAKITIPHLKKLDDRSIPIIYLGVEEGSKACRLYDPKGKRKHVSRDVRFMETKPWDWDNNREETSTQDSFWASFVVEGVDNGNTTQVNSESNDNNYEEQQPITAPDSPITPPTYTYNPDSEEAEEATSSSTKRSENGFDDTSVRGFKDLTEIYENARDVETKNLLFTKEEPCNYKEVSTDKKWIEAMEIELDLVNKNNIWTLTTLPTNHKAIGLKWVFNTKRDAKGEIIKYKARLVAKGCVQEQGIDFDEVFAPVACIKIVRTRAWNPVNLDQTLKSLDFKKCNLEQAVYTKRSKTSTLIVGVYVDDLIITGTPRKEIDLFKS